MSWLDKIIGSNAPSTGTVPAGAPTATPAPPRLPAKPEEPPLPPPRIVLDEADPGDVSAGLLTRQVIIGRKFLPVGYAFALQEAAGAPADALLRDELLLGVVRRLGVERLCRFRTLWLPVSDYSLASPALQALPPASTVLMLSIAAAPSDAGAMDAARQLKGRGFKLCLANWTGDPAQRAWLPLCDFVDVDTTAHTPIDAGEIPVSLLKAGSAAGVMASHIDSFEGFEFCHKANYFLFRGGFLTRRENWPRQARMAPDRVTVCNLLNQLRAGAELDAVAAPFRQSPELSYRFLRYINSVGFGLQIKVASVKQGMVYLGREKLYRWLTLLLFNPDQGRSTDGALLEQALVRGHMMEMLGHGRFSKIEGDELFIVGIFSVLDLLLKLPMSIALDPLKLPLAVHGALVNDEGIFAPYLRLAIACEENDTQGTATTAQSLGFTVEQVNAAHVAALGWAQDTLSPLGD